jgi:hypothetical protein
MIGEQTGCMGEQQALHATSLVEMVCCNCQAISSGILTTDGLENSVPPIDFKAH